jgi:glycosyltransferase involved in cell wall biosynthesis
MKGKIKTEPTKLLVVTPYFYPKIGGLENYAYNIAKGLKQDHGYKIVVVTSNHEDKTYKEETLEGIKIYRLPRQLKVSNTPISFKWKKQIKEIIEKEKPDVINAHSPVPFISDVACRIAHQKKIPFVLTYHNDLVKENWLLNLVCKSYYWFMGNRTLNQADKIIATSEYYVAISAHLKKRKNKIQIVSPGVNIPNIKPKPIKDSILFVGQLDKTHLHKGLNYLIDAVSEIRKVKLIVVGKGDNLENYIQLAKEKNISALFTGSISDKELTEFYNDTTLTVLPSYNQAEGFGMILIEAMACKKPVVGTNVGGIPYVIHNNKDGLLVPPKDSKALAEAIIKLLKNPKLAKQMGANGYKKVKENFTWQIQVKKTKEILKK